MTLYDALLFPVWCFVIAAIAATVCAWTVFVWWLGERFEAAAERRAARKK